MNQVCVGACTALELPSKVIGWSTLTLRLPMVIAVGPQSVTFNVKDFRAMLGLCEHMGRPLVLHMEGPGMPLLVEPGSEGTAGANCIEAQLVLATLVERGESATQNEITCAEDFMSGDPTGPRFVNFVLRPVGFGVCALRHPGISHHCSSGRPEDTWARLARRERWQT